jgi:hypothetical protein
MVVASTRTLNISRRSTRQREFEATAIARDVAAAGGKRIGRLARTCTNSATCRPLVLTRIIVHALVRIGNPDVVALGEGVGRILGPSPATGDDEMPLG